VPDTSAVDRVSLLQRLFPEKRIFLKSDDGTRFVRVGPRQQLLAGVAVGALAIWSAVSTAFLVTHLVSGAGVHEQLLTEKTLYEERLQDVADERDRYRLAALQAQESYGAALAQLGGFQDRLFGAELETETLTARTEALRRLLADANSARNEAETRLAALADADATAGIAELDRRRAQAEQALGFLTGALSRTARDREAISDAADVAAERLAELEREQQLKSERTDRILTRLEDAVTLAMEPLDKMFRDVGLPPEQILDDMREEYSGMGGPLTPIAFSAKGAPIMTPAELRANALLAQMDSLNLYRLAMESVPFANPVNARVRMTSGYGYRRHPIYGGTRMHEGIDLAGPHGTPILATADGVVTHAGWLSGYGRLVKIRHAFGVETRFAHLSKIDVKVGQRVSRGDRIGGMGNSGRSTGTHLHYEVRVGGTPVDPMTYIKAARDVF